MRPSAARPLALRSLTVASLCLGLSASAHAQISLTSAVSIALRSNPRVLQAQADLDRANAGVSQAKEIYVPAISVGGGLGYPFGFSANVPAIFSVTAGSLIFSFAQLHYTKSARLAAEAAAFSLKDSREVVATDTIVTYLALESDEERQAIHAEQVRLGDRLVKIIQERVDAGVDAPVELTKAKLSLAKLNLAILRSGDDAATDRAHLARLLALPEDSVTTNRLSLTTPLLPDSGFLPENSAGLPPVVKAAYASAESKLQNALGDADYVRRPQFSLGILYQQYAPYQGQSVLYPAGVYKDYLADLGVQFSLPIFDRFHKAKERESAAVARSAQHEADFARDSALDQRLRQRHTVETLRTQARVAELEVELAKQQLDAIHMQVQNGNGNLGGPQLTPKEEQNARIDERQRTLDLLDVQLQLRQSEVSLLRETGQMDSWLQTAALSYGQDSSSREAEPTTPTTPASGHPSVRMQTASPLPASPQPALLMPVPAPVPVPSSQP